MLVMGPVLILRMVPTKRDTSHRVKIGAVKILPWVAAETGSVDGFTMGMFVGKRRFFVSFTCVD